MTSSPTVQTPLNKDQEDWTLISDMAERRRVQNKLAQRKYRSDGTTTTGRKIKRRLEELERKASAMLPAAPRRTDFVVDNRNGDGNGNEKNGSGRQGLSRQEQSLQRRGMMNQNMVSFSLMDLNYGGRRYHHKLETTPSTSASIIGQTANKQPFRDYSNSHSSAQVSSSSAIAKVMTVQQPGGQHGFPLPENSR